MRGKGETTPFILSRIPPQYLHYRIFTTTPLPFPSCGIKIKREKVNLRLKWKMERTKPSIENLVNFKPKV
jgi:hypothetical protein